MSIKKQKANETFDAPNRIAGLRVSALSMRAFICGSGTFLFNENLVYRNHVLLTATECFFWSFSVLIQFRFWVRYREKS